MGSAANGSVCLLSACLLSVQALLLAGSILSQIGISENEEKDAKCVMGYCGTHKLPEKR